MVLDAVIVLIFAFFTIYGYRKGFVFSLIQTVGWVVALALAYVFTPYITSFFKNSTGFFDTLSSVIEGKLDVSLDNITNMFPTGLQPALSGYASGITEGISSSIANVFGVIMLFFAIFVAIKLLLWIAQRLLSRDYREGFFSTIDGILGGIFGAARSAIIIFLFLLVLMPLASLISSGLAGVLTSQLDQSLFAEYLYKNNPIIMLIQGYMNS